MLQHYSRWLGDGNGGQQISMKSLYEIQDSIRCSGYLFFVVKNASTSVSDCIRLLATVQKEKTCKKINKIKRPKISDKNIEINKTFEIIETKEIKPQYKGKIKFGNKWEKGKQTQLSFVREKLLKIMSSFQS